MAGPPPHGNRMAFPQQHMSPMQHMVGPGGSPHQPALNQQASQPSPLNPSMQQLPQPHQLPPYYPTQNQAPATPPVGTQPQQHLGSATAASQAKESPVAFTMLTIEILHEIISRATEVFKSLQLKIQDSINSVSQLFFHLHKLYQKVEETTAPDLKDLDPEDVVKKALVADDGVTTAKPTVTDDVTADDSPVVKQLKEQRQHLRQSLHTQTQYLKQVMDQQRTMLWEINSMMAMRPVTSSARDGGNT